MAGVSVSVVRTLGERDQRAADADASHEGHRQHDQRDQADRDRDTAEHHCPSGGLHGHHHGVVVVPAVIAFLSPSGDQDQRVVDRDAQADQRDQELDDERHVASRRSAAVGK